MRIEQPEDIDLLFKSGLNKLPVNFQEENWKQLNQLLDKKMPIHKQKTTFNFKHLLLITGALGLIVFCIWFFQPKKPTTIESQPAKKNNTTLLDSDSIANGSTTIEKTIPLNKTISPAKKISKKKTNDSINHTDSLDNYKHVFW